MEMSAKIENLVETSLNLGILKTEAEKVEEGDSIYLRLSNMQKIDANIEYIKDEGGHRLLILKIMRMILMKIGNLIEQNIADFQQIKRKTRQSWLLT